MLALPEILLVDGVLDVEDGSFPTYGLEAAAKPLNSLPVSDSRYVDLDPLLELRTY